MTSHFCSIFSRTLAGVTLMAEQPSHVLNIINAYTFYPKFPRNPSCPVYLKKVCNTKADFIKLFHKASN